MTGRIRLLGSVAPLKPLTSKPMASKKRIDRRKEFKQGRISWKYFSRKLQRDTRFRMGIDIHTIKPLMMLEILKELQYLNDRI